MAQIAKGDRDALGALYHQANTAVYSFAVHFEKHVRCGRCAARLLFGYLPGGGTLPSAGQAYGLDFYHCPEPLPAKSCGNGPRTADIPSEDWEPYLQSRESITPEDRLLIGTCMERLNQQERQIVVLHAVSGFRHREIAQLLQLPLPTVLSKYHRALKKLKKYVTEGGER